MDKTSITLQFSSEIEDVLVNQRANIVTELKAMGFEVERADQRLEAQSEGGRGKGIVLVLLAAAPIAVAVGNAVAQIIRELARRPIVIKEGESVVVAPTGNGATTTTTVKVGSIFEYKIDHKLGS